jgi:Flp pilus assembly protein TadD
LAAPLEIVSTLTAPAEPQTEAAGGAIAAPAEPQTEIAVGGVPGRRSSRERTWRRAALPLYTIAVAALLCLIVFYVKGGLAKNDLNLGPITTFEMALTLAGGLLIAAAVLLAPAGRPALGGKASYGQWPLALLLVLTGLTALSAVWSVQPDESWQEASLLLAYSALFAAAIVLARVAPARWEAVLGGVLLASVVVCAWALLTKVLPGQLDTNDTYARLRVPYGYWNAIGLTAAMGVVACLWLGARRSGHALLRALAYPAMGLMLVTLLLAYSRGALIAVGAGVALWLCVTPLRLRGAALLLSSGAGAALVVGWTFAQHALSSDGVALAQRAQAGGELGVLLVALLLALSASGVAIGFASARHAPRPRLRRRLGIALLCLPLLAVLAVLALLAHSPRGLTGSISHDVSSLTNPNAPVPKNTPGRLTSVGSVRARYWNEALEVFSEHPALGAGGGGYETARLRHRQETLDVKNAHGFIVETLADLGLLGLLAVLALLAVWMAAAGRATHPFNRRWQRWAWRPIAAPYPPERIGLLTMLCVVVTFGVHSLVDWTWYVPGDACVALLCAGWLAGRGPLAAAVIPLTAGQTQQTEATAQALKTETGIQTQAPPQDTQIHTPPTSTRAIRPNATRGLVAAAVMIGVLLAAWAQWQPLRSADASNAALALLPSDPAGARAQAQTAVARDPLSAQALFTLATVEQRTGEVAQARATLQRAVRLQPSNPQTWVALGEYDLQANDPQEALKALRAAVYLNPEVVAPEATIAEDPELLDVRNAYLVALRQAAAK